MTKTTLYCRFYLAQRSNSSKYLKTHWTISMEDPLSSQRMEDVISFLEQVESKMGKSNIDGLVGKLKMKHPKFIAVLKTKVMEQFAARVYSNWPTKKKLNLLFVLNKYLQDPIKRQESKEWTEAFDHLLASILPETNDSRDASHISKLLKHWKIDGFFPSESLKGWQVLHDRYLQPILDEANKTTVSNERSSKQDSFFVDPQESSFIPTSSSSLSERRRRSLSFIEQQIRGQQTQVRDRCVFAMRKFLFDAYRHFIHASVSLNDALHWRVVIASSFWLLNQYILHEFFDIDKPSTLWRGSDDPLVVCSACIYLSGKAEQYFIRSEKLRDVAQKCMYTHFSGISHSSYQPNSSLNLPGDASLFQMELKLLRLIDYNIGEIVNPCRTLRDWLLHKRIDQETFQKTTAMIVKEDHLSGHFHFGIDPFDHDNILAFFLLLAQAVFPQTDIQYETQSDGQQQATEIIFVNSEIDNDLCLKNSLEGIFKDSKVFAELQWNESLKEMVLSIQCKPLVEIGEIHSLQFVRVFLQLWDIYYPLRQENCLMQKQETMNTKVQMKGVEKIHVVTPSTPACATNSYISSTVSNSHSIGKDSAKKSLPIPSSPFNKYSRGNASFPPLSGQKRPRSDYRMKDDWYHSPRQDNYCFGDHRYEENSCRTFSSTDLNNSYDGRGYHHQYHKQTHHRERSYYHHSNENSPRDQYCRGSYQYHTLSSQDITPAKTFDDKTMKCLSMSDRSMKKERYDESLTVIDKTERKQVGQNHHHLFHCVNNGVAICMDAVENVEIREREVGKCASDVDENIHENLQNKCDSAAEDFSSHIAFEDSQNFGCISESINIESTTVKTSLTIEQVCISKEGIEVKSKPSENNADIHASKSDLSTIVDVDGNSCVSDPTKGESSPKTNAAIPPPPLSCRESSTSSVTSFQRRSLWGIAISGVKTQASATTAVTHVVAKRSREESSDDVISAGCERKMPRVASLVVEHTSGQNRNNQILPTDAQLPDTIDNKQWPTASTYDSQSTHHHRHHYQSSHDRYNRNSGYRGQKHHHLFHSKR